MVHRKPAPGGRGVALFVGAAFRPGIAALAALSRVLAPRAMPAWLPGAGLPCRPVGGIVTRPRGP